MKIVCVHCGHSFPIRPEQLGKRVACPHCREGVPLPKADDQPSEEPSETNWRQMFDHATAGLVSMIFHMTVFLGLVFFDAGGSPTVGPGDEVQIGTLPEEVLASSPGEGLQMETADTPSDSPSSVSDSLEAESPVLTTSIEVSDATESLAAPSLTGSDAAGFDLGSVGIGSGGGMAGGGSWDGLLRNLRRGGLDIVIVFDSTGSMTGEIDTVKDQIRKIGTTLLALIPKARLSLCTYRDVGDAYQVKGEPLTSDLQKLETFLRTVTADGGGDEPEGVDAGLYWAVHQNRFRPTARKVILVFGDAPPHVENQPTCLKIAKEFRLQQKGIVSTITCRKRDFLPEFYAIADAGGGEAYLSQEERQIMTKLIVLVFGSQHKDKVLEAFKLYDKK